MGEALKNKDYRKEETIKLIEKYKDLIQKTFSVADKDLLQDKIDDDTDETQSEQKYLEAIKKRRLAFDEVDIMLDKIDKLEQQINPESKDSEEKEAVKQNFAKRNAAK